MNICQINDHDVANGPGVRVSLFVSGCTFKCPGCHNPEAQSFQYGEPFDICGEAKIMNTLCKPHISGLSILGGEPLHPKNIVAVEKLCELVRMKFHHDKTIWVWTGYTAEELIEIISELDTKLFKTASEEVQAMYRLLHMIDVIVEGRFDENQRDLRLKFRGSANQRIIVAPNLIAKKITILPDETI